MIKQPAAAELSFRSVLLGIVLGFVFAVGNAYLGLKVGMTVSASIPAAVMSMAIFRILPKKGTIQENNIVQTIASAGESLAAGVIFTIPALIFLGAPPSWWQVFALSILGGTLGVLMMIPLRHHLIVTEHETLPYPEGTACAKILQAKEGSRDKALLALWGGLLGSGYKALMSIFHLWKEVLSGTVVRLFSMSIDTTPALLGVGYLIGVRYALIMFAGGIVAWWVLIPIISLFGLDSVIYPGQIPIIRMSPDQLWSEYVRYIGTGAVALGGVVSLFRLLPVLYRSIHGHVKAMLTDAFKSHGAAMTERDLPFIWALIGSGVALFLLWVLPGIHLNWLAILLVLVLAFLFVGLTSVTVGIVGASSNPVSGMIILTVLATALIFLALDWTSAGYLIMAMMVGAVVGISLAIASDTSQDLKTGYLVGATPYRQQIGMLIGLVVPALVMGYVLRLLHATYGFGTDELPAPQAVLMSVVVKGVMQQTLPFSLVVIGILLGVAVELLRIRALPLALGIYLPVSTTSAIAVGGVLAWLVGRLSRTPDLKERGVLLGSGLVAGDALMGVLIALLTVVGWISPTVRALTPPWVSAVVYVGLVATYAWLALFRRRS